LVNGNKKAIYKQAEILTADFYCKHFNKLIPTTSQSKFFKLEVPRLQTPETKAELAISAKKIISCILAPIAVLHETH
jgi:hypothetical protein